MPEATFVHPLFGAVRFKTKEDFWKRGDKITFLSGFDVNDVTTATIPQLVGIPGTHNGNLKFHKRAHAQVLAAFADIERLGLLGHIKTCAGSFNTRLKKPTSGALSKEPSNHAFGIAIDLNADDGSLGASVAPVAPVFEALGFKWGKSFNDPMHFEVKAFIDHPNPITHAVTTQLDDATINIQARTLTGDLVADVSLATAAFNLKTTRVAGGRIRVKGPKATRTLILRKFGDNSFASLAEMSGAAGLAMSFDNDAKTAHFTQV